MEKKELGRKRRKKWNQYWRASFSACSNWLWIKLRNALTDSGKQGYIQRLPSFNFHFILYLSPFVNTLAYKNSSNRYQGHSEQTVDPLNTPAWDTSINRWAIYIHDWDENRETFWETFLFECTKNICLVTRRMKRSGKWVQEFQGNRKVTFLEDWFFPWFPYSTTKDR